MDTPKNRVAASTVTGPVGRLETDALIHVPTAPLAAPNIPDHTIMSPSRSVQYLAETAGVIRSAATSTTPTA
ncbi:hypothetical protein D3C80_1896200 [compost metagenome]